jgi:hypothetical protein
VDVKVGDGAVVYINANSHFQSVIEAIGENPNGGKIYRMRPENPGQALWWPEQNVFKITDGPGATK